MLLYYHLDSGQASVNRMTFVFHMHLAALGGKNYPSLAPMSKRVSSICLDIRAVPESLNIYAQICETSNRNERRQKRPELLRTLT